MKPIQFSQANSLSEPLKNSGKTILAIIAVALTIGYVWQSNRVFTQGPATWEDVKAEAEAGGYRIVTTEELAKRYRKKTSDLLLVDTRQGWEYRTGHIEGAVNFPMEPTWWARWRKADELEAFLGPDKDRVLVFY